MKKVRRILAWVLALILMFGSNGINPIFANAEGPVSSFEVSISYEGTTPTRYGVEWEFIKSNGDSLGVDNTSTSKTVTVLDGADKVLLRVYHSSGKEVWLGDSQTYDYDDWKEIPVSELASSYEFKLKDDPFWDGFPASFGTSTHTVNARNRVDMDNQHNDETWGENFHTQGEFPVEELPPSITLNGLLTGYNGISFKAKIVDVYTGCKVDEVIYGFGVETSNGPAKVEFRQGYPTPIALTKDAGVTFDLNMDICKEFNSIEILVPDGMTYNDIKNLSITSISAEFNLNQKGTVSYVAPGATGFPVDSSKPYLEIVIPEIEVVGDYNEWGSWQNIKAIYTAEDNKGTNFATYQDLLQNYKGIKIKVDVSNIDSRFNKDNEIFFYLHDPQDGMQPGTVENGVKYDITDGHNQANKQYVKKNGGVQEFTFDFAGTYYLDGSAAPDIWLAMALETSRTAKDAGVPDVHFCDIKPVIENSNGTISLGDGCEKMQFNTASDTLMDVETATKISLNVSDEASVLSAIGGTETPSDLKQADLKSLIESNENMGTDESATEQVKQVMEINLSVGGTEIQPRGNNVKVSIPVSKFGDVNTQKLRLYHHVGGTLVEITNVKVKDGMVSFDTPSFSYFVVVEDSSIPDAPEEDDKDDSKDDSSDKTEIVSTVTATESVVGISTSNAGGYGRELASSMLIGDINATAAGSTLVVDRRYNRQYLSNDEMKALLNKGTVTLCMQYEYNGTEYVTVIPVGSAIDDAIPYYGPLYLAALYAETTTVIVGNGGAISSSNAGGFGRELSSSMLVNDITNAIPGTTLVIDRRYNRQYLTNAEMMALVNKQTVSLRMQYNYNGVEYDILIPAGVGVNNILAYYGPLYLAAYYR